MTPLAPKVINPPLLHLHAGFDRLSPQSAARDAQPAATCADGASPVPSAWPFMAARLNSRSPPSARIFDLHGDKLRGNDK